MTALDPQFEEHRSALYGLAYRMLGSWTDADDVLQDAYLRWMGQNHAGIDRPKAYLHTVVTRLCLDQQRARQACREQYVGPWLPEPSVAPMGTKPADPLEIAESVSLAFLIVLESLSPAERAAYLLRKTFDYDYAEIAKILEKSETACRQLVSRAEARVQESRPRQPADPKEAERLASAFLNACATGDLAGLIQLLAPDAVLTADGGGKSPAALAQIHSADHVARFSLGVVKKFSFGLQAKLVLVNGVPGFLITGPGGIVDSVLAFQVADGCIQEVYSIRNPDKLKKISLNSLS